MIHTGSLVSDAGRKITYIKYDYNNNPVLIYFTDGSETEYVYSATGEKLRVKYITAKKNVITREIGKDITERLPENYRVSTPETIDYLLGGALTLRNGVIDKYQFEEGYCQATPLYWEGKPFAETFTFCYYDQDHLGNIRQVTRDDGSKMGEVIQRMNYYPFGAEFCDNSTKSYVQNHKYNGKEFDNMHGLNTYDYGARQYNPVTARWDRMDPLSEKYYSTSPYAYCMNNPVRFIDPDGRVCGDFYDEKGHYLGNDGQADGKVYIIKTSETSFGEGNSKVLGAGLSNKIIKETKKFIKSNSGNTDAFMNNTIAYDNSIEIESSLSTRQAMVDQVSKDNGKGGTKDANNREYGGEITPEGITPRIGAVFSPKTSSSATIELNSTDYSTFHGHPSGSVVEINNPSTSSSISFSMKSTTYSFTQSPSPLDISNAHSHTHYVFGRANGITYIYNSNGVQATIPTKKFVNLQK